MTSKSRRAVVSPTPVMSYVVSYEFISTDPHIQTGSFPLRFNDQFPGGPGLSGTRMSPFWNFTGAKGDGAGGNNWSYKTRKAPVKSSPSTNQHPVFLQTGCPSCRPTNSVRVLKVNQTGSLLTIYMLATAAISKFSEASLFLPLQ